MKAEVRLWDGVAPGSEGWTHVEVGVGSIPDAPGAVRNVVVPTLTAHLPSEPASRAVVVVPGGAFHLVSMDNEGHDVARFLADHGVAAFVLKYRVVPTPPDDAGFHAALADAFVSGMEDAVAPILPLCIADAERAIEMVRRDGGRDGGADGGADGGRDGYAHVGLLGFSAGARIVADLVVGSPRERRPDSAGSIYAPPVRTVDVPVDAPPLFVAVAADDPIVGIDGSLRLHDLWRVAGRPVELHVFERGGHGFGMKRQGLPVDRWAEGYLAWLDGYS